MKIEIEFYFNGHWKKEGMFLFNILPCIYISNDYGFTLGVGWLILGLEIRKMESITLCGIK